MKKIILLLLFIPLVSFGQDEVTVVAVKSETNIKNQRALVLSDEKTTIKTPLTADLSNYTHLLIIDATLDANFRSSHMCNWDNPGMCKQTSKHLKKLLSLTAFEIMNPYEIDNRRAKKESNFLRTIKNESYLYLNFVDEEGRGDDINTTFIIRDWKNKIIYNATHINTGLNEILAPLIDY